MRRRTVDVDSRRYTLAIADPPLLVERFWGVVQARAVDEITGEALRTPPTVSTTHRGLSPRVASDGLIGLVGIPLQAFPALDGYSVPMTVEAEGYIPRRERVTITNVPRRLVTTAPGIGSTVITLNDSTGLSAGQTLLLEPATPRQEKAEILSIGPGGNPITLAGGLRHAHPLITPILPPVFPDAFTPTNLGNLSMHRRPVTILGRTVTAGGSAAAGATIRITGIWPTPPPVVTPPPADDPNVVVLRSALYVARTVTAGRVRRITIAAGPGPDKSLLEDSSVGSNVLRLSNRQNLLPRSATHPIPDVLLVDAPGTVGDPNPDLAEYATVETIVGNSPGQPAEITLTYPLTHPHRRGARVRRVIPQGPGAANQLRPGREAIGGDTCLLLNTMSGLVGATTVEVSGGAEREFHDVVSRYVAPPAPAKPFLEVNSFGDGYFRFPPLSRVAEIEIEAMHPSGAPTRTRILSLDYTRVENRIDFVF